MQNRPVSKYRAFLYQFVIGVRQLILLPRLCYKHVSFYLNLNTKNNYDMYTHAFNEGSQFFRCANVI